MKKTIRRVFWGVLTLFTLLVVARIPFVYQNEKTAEAVAEIHATKLTMADVMGENLPPEPDSELKDATIAGIDANKNGIRDDVELAIFAKYPNSARIRSAELQYALGLQMLLTKVFNSETLVAVLKEKGRGFGCVYSTGPKVTLADSEEKWIEQDRIVRARLGEVESLVVNTQIRQDRKDAAYEYMTSYGDTDGPDCDIDPTTLQN